MINFSLFLRIIMNIRIILFLCIVMKTNIKCVNIGSDTTPTRFNTQQTLNNGDRIAGFAALAGGFALASSSVTGIFDSFFAVSGPIALNEGTLALFQDLIFHNNTSINSLGNMYGNSHVLNFSNMNSIPNPTGSLNAGCFTFSNITILHSSNIVFHDCCITFTGNNIWNGQGYSLDLDITCTINVAKGASLMLKDMTLLGLETGRLNVLDSTSTLTLNNIQASLINNYTFNLGLLDIINNVSISGNGHSFIFTTSTACHITTESQLTLESNITFSYAPANSSPNMFLFDSASSYLMLSDTTLITSSAGLQLITGKLLFDGACTLINTGTSNATAIQFGNGIAANDLSIEVLPAAVVILNQGFLSYNNV